MANKGVGGGRPRSGGAKGGGKSGQGPRQPAGRKYGSAGPVKTGSRGFGTKTARPETAGRSAARRGPGERQGQASGGTAAKGDWGRPQRGGPAKTSRGKAPAGAGRGQDTRPRRPQDARPEGRGQEAGRGDRGRPQARTAGKSSWDKGAAPARRGQAASGFRSDAPRPAGRTAGPGTGRGAVRGERDSTRTRTPRPSSAEAARPVKPVAEKPALIDQDWQTTELEGKVVGLNPVLELLRSGGRKVDTIFIDSAKGGKLFNDIMGAARAQGITVKLIPKNALDNMSMGLRHQGAVAVVSPKEYADPDELVGSAMENNAKPLFVLLDGVEDPQNLGSVIRTADAAGAAGVFIPEHRAAHLSASVARASAGALEHVPVAKVKNMAAFIEALKKSGVWVVGVESGSDKGYTQFSMDVPLAVVLGSEGAGVRPVVLKACDAVVSLPMHGMVNSLNVSVAAGVVLYEVLRQRGNKQA